MWRPTVGPGRETAAWWDGTVRLADDGKTWVPDRGKLVLGDWPNGGADTQVLADGSLTDWDVQWSDTGELAVWVTRDDAAKLGKLSLFTVDPATGRVDLAHPKLDAEPAFAGFALKPGRLAWSAPAEGGDTSVEVLGWDGDAVRPGLPAGDDGGGDPPLTLGTAAAACPIRRPAGRARFARAGLMEYPPAVMRRRTVVAVAALIAAFALAGLPVPAGSRTPSTDRTLDQAAFTSVTIPANAEALSAPGLSVVDLRSAGHVTADDTFLEPGEAPDGPTSRPRVTQPGRRPGRTGRLPSRSCPGSRRSTTTGPRPCGCRAARSCGSAATGAASSAP